MSPEINYASMLDELMKIAVEAPPPAPNTGLSTGQKIVGGGALYLGSNAAFTLGQQKLSPMLARKVKPSGEKMGLRDVINLRKNLSPGTAVSNAPHWSTSLFGPKGGLLPKFMRPMETQNYERMGMNPNAIRNAFARGTAHAPLAHSPEFLSHELGHASLRDPKKTGLLLRTAIKGRLLGGPAGIAAGSAMAMQDPESLTAQMAPAAVAAGWAPLLADEGIASYRGLKAVKGLGKYSPEALKLMRNNLLRAGSTYGLAAGATVLPALAVTRWRKHNAEQARLNPQG